mmetsp:Transcript_16937/g.30705  ORF Transcript_16937/g.30705 Transcript_16937/m.30705 type:complete len:88 (+) Transcript_16937:100-363(+)
MLLTKKKKTMLLSIIFLPFDNSALIQCSIFLGAFRFSIFYRVAKSSLLTSLEVRKLCQSDGKAVVGCKDELIPGVSSLEIELPNRFR